MKTVAGIFNSRGNAEQAVSRLRSAGVVEDQISILAPGTDHDQVQAEVPTTETEQPGVGKAIGAAVGGALGVAGGLHLGAVLASLFIPGVGPILAAGVIGGALLGAGGAATGMAAGEALEGSLDSGLSPDELFVYEDALRQGRTVVIVSADDDEGGDRVRQVLEESGAESVDAARESWWVGLRDAEKAEYDVEGADFTNDEPKYRRGFEAALHPRARGRSYDEDIERLRECYGDECEIAPFRRGYQRGRSYHQSMLEKHKS